LIFLKNLLESTTVVPQADTPTTPARWHLFFITLDEKFGKPKNSLKSTGHKHKLHPHPHPRPYLNLCPDTFFALTLTFTVGSLNVSKESVVGVFVWGATVVLLSARKFRKSSIYVGVIVTAVIYGNYS
jgi:hypothetical protein